jgi:FMN phosphatase YigB (HAD superfamily)
MLLEKLHTEEVGLHIATHWTVAAARGLLLGSGVLAYFSQPIFGMDVTCAFEKDYAYLALKVGVSPECCLVVDGDPTALGRAGDAGMRTALVERGSGLSYLLGIVLKPQEIFPQLTRSHFRCGSCC